jgi:CDP-diglyceride synthetase
MACASPVYLDGTHWFLFVAVVSFIATLIWIFIYFLSVREALKLPINWILTVIHSVQLDYTDGNTQCPTG